MPLFAVIREEGPAWDRAKSRRKQAAWDAHAAYMDRGEADGFFRLAGPLDGGPQVLLIVEGPDAATIRGRLEEDPWTPLGLLRTVSITPWTVLVGARRLGARPPPAPA